MPYSIRFNDVLRCVETTYEDVVLATELTQAAIETIAAGVANDSKLFFGDCTRLVGGHSIADLFVLMEQLAKLGLPRGAREALLYPTIEDRARDVDFWETICVNRGFQVRAFDDRETAIRWLTGRDANARGA